MLGDEDEKKPGHSLNPLKKAIKRRNMKTVQFTAPSYVEPSDVEYSSDEEGDGDEGYLGQEQDNVATQNDDQEREIEQSAVVEPLKPRGQTRDARQNGELNGSAARNSNHGQATVAEDVRSSDDTFERSGTLDTDLYHIHWLTILDDGTVAKSRKGTVRNTDSFFKDDSLETRKINLTPSLLRDDSKGAIAASSESNEVGILSIFPTFWTNRFTNSLRQGQVLTHSKRTIPRKKARKTRNRKKREECSAACSNARTRRAKVGKRRQRNPRKLLRRFLGCHLSQKNL